MEKQQICNSGTDFFVYSIQLQHELYVTSNMSFMLSCEEKG